MPFSLDPRLAADSHFLATGQICQIRLQNDARFLWLVLVPQIENAVELDALTPAERAQILEDVAAASHAVRALGAGLGGPIDKINIGSLGNIVPQLHIHVIGRRRDDPCWPGPVWGCGEPERYSREGLSAIERVFRW